MRFKLISDMTPMGDQPRAIEKLVEGINKGYRFQTLLGVTGSGKTFTMANVIEKLQRPTLVISPNKTLAAQLYKEFKSFFPENKIEFFISYYDYYQPEAYVPTKDLYIEKNADINDIIMRMRLSTLRSVLTRRDVVVVASVSCIYASGDPNDFRSLNLRLAVGEEIKRRKLLEKLSKMQYERTEDLSKAGAFRLKGEILEIIPSYEEVGIRIEFFDDEIERILSFDPLNRSILEEYDKIVIYPAKEYITTDEKIKLAIESIKKELKDQISYFKSQGKLLEAQRIEQRTLQDIEMLSELGYCNGIENYSRHFDGRRPGEPPWTLLDYFDEDLIVFIDESHITIPQLRAMHRGDKSRKKNLVEYGFRLPSAYDNRPLTFEEFLRKVKQIIFVSATPGDYEHEVSSQIVEQLIRPTGLVDPEVILRPTENQIDNLLEEIRVVKSRNEKALVTTLTKKMAERLSDYLREMGIRALYLHSELGSVERVEVLRKLRSGEIDVVVGVNLLREGLDLPEVSLVAILDADAEGFLRSETTLIQTIGRAARNINGKVILYADKVTDAMKRAINETNRRRKKQMEYNLKHNITPKSVVKPLDEDMFAQFRVEESTKYEEFSEEVEMVLKMGENLEIDDYISLLEEEMYKAASELRYEDAAKLRDRILELKKSNFN
ncbi:MAG TPA: excinuclease ABC subunit UvrB [Thermotogaceae bacterium]|nr:excinuclease ABC subunit UvrB [Thermotogaceae bacterium]